jgi:putative phosphoribosyl transferase
MSRPASTAPPVGGFRLPLRFSDRREAGRYLGRALAELAEHDRLLVLAIPRGGVPVGYEVATALGAPLDVITVRKLGHPEQPELAMGAIASGGVRVLNPDVTLGVSQLAIERVTERERRELERRERAYRGDRPPEDPAGRVVVLVDDGLATGASMRAAIAALRQRGPARIIAAVPVAPPSAATQMRLLADRFVCLILSEIFLGVGEWYEDFSPTTDDEVRDLLAEAAHGLQRREG